VTLYAGHLIAPWCPGHIIGAGGRARDLNASPA